ncbi:unnamed protein product, partial [marine sediment metagenome]
MKKLLKMAKTNRINSWFGWEKYKKLIKAYWKVFKGNYTRLKKIGS